MSTWQSSYVLRKSQKVKADNLGALEAEDSLSKNNLMTWHVTLLANERGDTLRATSFSFRLFTQHRTARHCSSWHERRRKYIHNDPTSLVGKVSRWADTSQTGFFSVKSPFLNRAFFSSAAQSELDLSAGQSWTTLQHSVRYLRDDSMLCRWLAVPLPPLMFSPARRFTATHLTEVCEIVQHS